MSWHRRIWNLVRGPRLARNLRRELEFHISERADQLEAEGLARAQAEHAARLQFGNVTVQLERTRDMAINQSLEAVIRNLRHATRGLLRTPAFTATVVLTLALGIGANSAVFSAINAVLLRPLPFPDSDRLVQLMQTQAKSKQQSAAGGVTQLVAPSRLEDWNRLTTTFQAISGAYTDDASELSGELPEKLKRAFVAPRYLQVWGVAPVLGRDFSPREEHFGGPNSVLISDRLWRRRFNSDAAAAGKTLRIGSATLTVIGVLPASFDKPSREVDLWLMSAPDAPYARSRANTWFDVFGRLKPGVSIAQAQANLAAVQSGLGSQFPKTDRDLSIEVQALKDTTVKGVRRSLWLLFVSVSLLLLIACTNIAALLLARAAGRRQETAVRFSLGASRGAIAAQSLTEVLLLALAGCGLGLLLASTAIQTFAWLARDLPRIAEIRLNGTIVLYSLACAIAVTLLCGFYPALQSTRCGLSGGIASAGRSQVSSRTPVQFVLVSVQVALAVTLLMGAGLLVRSFQALGNVAAGFDPEHVLTFHVSTSWAETNDRTGSRQRVDRLLECIRSLPGVEQASTSLTLPGVPNNFQMELPIEGRAATEPKVASQSRWVEPTYFATLHIPLLEGEMCREETTNMQLMVNRSFADAFLNGQRVVGRKVLPVANSYLGGGEIRGIVGDAREQGLDHAPPPTVYWCGGGNQPGTFFIVRTRGKPLAMAETIRRRVFEVEPQRSVFGLSPLTEHLSDAYAQNRLRTVLITFFALTAVALACIGTYGTLSYLVQVRRREVALRLALGAARSQVTRHILAQGLRVTLIGCAGGIALAAALSHLLQDMLYGVSSSDPATLAGVIALVSSCRCLPRSSRHSAPLV